MGLHGKGVFGRNIANMKGTKRLKCPECEQVFVVGSYNRHNRGWCYEKDVSISKWLKEQTVEAGEQAISLVDIEKAVLKVYPSLMGAFERLEESIDSLNKTIEEVNKQ